MKDVDSTYEPQLIDQENLIKRYQDSVDRDRAEKERILEFLESLDPLTFKCEQWLADHIDKEDLGEAERIVLNTMKAMKKNHPDMPNVLFTRGYLNYADWDGEEIQLWEWMFKSNYLGKHIGDETIGDFRVSTVWLGMNHGYEGCRLVFETMIFCENNTKHDLNNWLDRYSTYEQALKGHNRVCDLLREGREKELLEEQS